VREGIRTGAICAAFAAGSLAASLLIFGTGSPAVSWAASATAAAKNEPDFTALPLGDGKVSSAPGRGLLFSCQTSFNGTAPGSGPWIDQAAGTYNLSAKYVVDGAIEWPATFAKKIRKVKLKLSGNGLPTDHTTGIFPIQPSDDAYQVDRNPNSIAAQSVALTLAADPKRDKRAECVGGEVGIAKNGVAIFNAVDAAGQDAVAHEVQDSCSGHPQQAGVYHYHGLPACIGSGGGKGHSKLVGWALDGFPIYGPLGQKGRYMRLDDLDACHGHTHLISYQGEKVKLFHYHATDEFPYTVGCYRGDAVQLNPGGGGTPPAGPPPQP
jgi:hypothetical protein